MLVNIFYYPLIIFQIHFYFFQTDWKPYNGPSGPETDGIFAGLYSNDQYAYVGRGTVSGQLAPGTLLIKNSGTHTAGFYMEHSHAEHYLTSNIEYYAKEPSCDYEWVESSNGNVVQNAIEHKSAPYTFYVGRTFNQGFWHVGKVTLELQTMYFGKGLGTKFYEVLVCNPKSTQIQSKSADKAELDTNDSTDEICQLKVGLVSLQAEVKLKNFKIDDLINENMHLASKLKVALQENLSLMTRVIECESKNIA